MTDLSELFRHKTISSSSSAPRRNLPSLINQTFTTKNLNSSFKPSYESDKYRKSPIDFTISVQAKKKITYDEMQDQIAWFQSQNIQQCLIKLLIIGILACFAYYRSITGLNTSFTIFVYSFLLFGLQHNIFGANIIKSWAYCSLIGTSFVLSHQIFIYFIHKISPYVASQLYYTDHSLIPASYITAMILILYHSLPILTNSSPYSVIHGILSYPATLFQFLRVIQRLKYAILQTYSIMLILTFLASVFWHYNEGDFYQIEEFFTYIVHPYTIMAQVIVFFVFVMFIHFLVKIVSSLITRFANTVFYNDKNIHKTKLPIILQLLKVNQKDTIWTNQSKSSENIVYLIKKLFKLDFSFDDNQQRKLSRLEVQNIYNHSLVWLKDLIIYNPNALNTKISTSKFYNTYYDIFRQFSQFEVQKCSSSLFDLSNKIDNYNILRSKNNGLREDLFYWFRIVKKQFQIWMIAIQTCRIMRITDQIIQILQAAEIGKQHWITSQIGISFQEIHERTQKLKENPKLNPVIREKMSEYEKKTKNILKIQ